jgi:Protein of unknown function (DUF2817)
VGNLSIQLFPKILSDLDRYAWLFKQLGVDSGVNKAPYQSQGLMGAWLGQKLAEKDYLYLNAEFGTYSGIKMLARLRSENRVYFYGKPDDHIYKRAKVQLLDAFCPSDDKWRQIVFMDGLALIKLGEVAFAEALARSHRARLAAIGPEGCEGLDDLLQT